jgi:hypothetical protein
MCMTGCRREAPPHGYTVFGVDGRYLAARLYPGAMGIVFVGGPEGVDLFKKWRRHRVVPAVPEEEPPCRHPILRHLRLLGIILNWPPNAVRCAMTRGSRSLTRRDVSPVP